MKCESYVLKILAIAASSFILSQPANAQNNSNGASAEEAGYKRTVKTYGTNQVAPTTTYRSYAPQVSNYRSAQTTFSSRQVGQPTIERSSKFGAGADDIVVLQEGRPMVALSNQWQKDMQSITLKPGDVRLPLSLTIMNGMAGRPMFRQLRIWLSGRLLVTERDFKGKQKLPIDLTNTSSLGNGVNQLIIDGQGPIGATLSWQLTTVGPKIISVNPTIVGPGDVFTIEGKNFSVPANINIARIGDTVSYIQSATPQKLAVIVSDDTKPGKQMVTVTKGTIQSNAIQVEVKPTPILTGCDYYQAPPGNEITVSGKNFSSVANENKVTINDYAAQVVSGSSTSLKVIVPDMPDWSTGIEKVPIVVTTNGVKSKGRVTILVRTGLARPFDGTIPWFH